MLVTQLKDFMNRSFSKTSIWKVFISCCLLVIGSLNITITNVYAQTSIILTEIPANTPENDTLYIVGSFNGWNPNNADYRFRKNAEGFYEFTLPIEIHSGEFKITRGSWGSVESSYEGYPISNRLIKRGHINPRTINVAIKGWEDLSNKYSVTFVVTEVPENTPYDALFVVGNFNDWDPGDPHYKMKSNGDGTYSLTILTNKDTLKYKYTRGNWSSVESRSNGRFLMNRSHLMNGLPTANLEDTISGWEDIVVGTSRMYMVILFMAAFQGLFLIVAIYGLPKQNQEANSMLALVILVVALSLLGRVTAYERIVYEFQPRLILLTDISYFLIGPLFYLYMQKLLTIQMRASNKVYLHFVPAVLQLLIYIPLLLTETGAFKDNVTNQEYYNLFVGLGGLALLYNIYYLYKCGRVLKYYKAEMNNTHSFESNLGYLSNFIKLGFACLVLWGFLYIIHFPALFFEFNTVEISETITDLLWVAFSIFTYFLGYYTMTQPEVFRLVKEDENVVSEEKQKYANLPDETMMEMKYELDILMKNKKPYLNPKLSLQELAEMLNSNIHTTSKLINDGYGKNFHDFVNEFRIEEFKQYVLSGKYKNYTFLSIAFEVGFSSKTTFNRAFKKSTEITPRDYLNKVVQESQMQVQ